MPWCPKCKLEYVNGSKMCPDCNCDLVSSLSDIVEEKEEDSYEAITGKQLTTLSEMPETENLSALRLAMMQQAQNATAKYDCIEDTYADNRSGAGVLILCGIAGLVFLLLNALGIVHIPMSGFGLVLTYVVMGCLFFVFLASGVRSIFKAKQLKPLVEVEKKDIEDAKNYLKELMDSYQFRVLREDGSESSYLLIYEMAVKELEKHMPDSAEGFSVFVCDKYLSDIIDED